MTSFRRIIRTKQRRRRFSRFARNERGNL